jgi:predicted phosphoribosyltransferase
MEEYWEGPKYADRKKTGRVLAEKLEGYRKARLIVLAIPNGGVSVGLPVARELNCLIRPTIVRKLQIPDTPEAGFGSVASDGSLFFCEALAQRLGLTKETIAAQKAKALRSIKARLGRYGEIWTMPKSSAC